MNNQAKFNFLSQFNLIGEHGENDPMKSIKNPTPFIKLYENGIDTGEDYRNALMNYFNEDDIAVDICIEFVQDLDDWERFQDELFENSTKLWSDDEEYFEVYNHPVMGNYIAINDDNSGYIFSFDKK